MSAPQFSQKTAVITGASRGLGAGMARDFAARGMRLGLCSRTAPALPPSERVVCAQLDVANRDAVEDFAEQIFRRFGHVDLWINNAGVLGPVRFVHDLDGAALLDHLRTNLVGVLHGSGAYVRRLRQTAAGGVLINISSGAARRGYAGWGCYASGKAAVDRLTECVQEEERAYGLRAHAVAPGVIDTDMQTTIRALSEQQFPAVHKFHALKQREAFNSPAFVANELLRIAFDAQATPKSVVVRLANEKAD
ncbi:MAG TPA: SDR family NAD(P)-dependent oxidoreductase [Sorangium sp.]|nr:SDR family NAD(P)-dependent oxidoreductase [Sorangium sp.]